MTTATAPVTRDILEDRWAGLMLTANSPSELQEQLDEVLWQILEGISRVGRNWEGFESFGAIDDSIDAIHRVMIDKIDAAGIAS